MALTASELTTALVKQEVMFADSAKKQDYVANVESARAVIENTTARLEYLTDTSDQKNRKAKIYWNEVCGITPSTGTPAYCAPSGTKPNSNGKEFEIAKKTSSVFQIDEADYVNNALMIPEVFADTLLKHMKANDEKIAQTVVASVDSFAQVNAYQGGVGCTDGTGTWIETFINPTFWGPQLMGYFRQAAIKNKFANAFLLDGSNLFQHFWNAKMNAANANGAGAKNMFDEMKYYSDLFNVEAVAEGSTFMIDRGTVAFASKAWWTGINQTAPKIDADGRKKFSIKSNNIPGLEYDVYIKSECSAQFEKHNVLLVAEYDIFNGAAACNDATGVLKFTCGACPTVTP